MSQRSNQTGEPADPDVGLLGAALERSADAVAVVGPERRIVWTNAAYARLLGYDDPEALRGLAWQVVHAADEEDRLGRTADEILGEKESWRGELMGRTRTGEPVPLDVTVTRLDAGRLLYVARGQREDHELQERLQKLAYYDPLTRLANRRLLRERAEHAFALSQRHGHDVALLYLDLDSFKSINDSLGHAAGDRTLEEVAGRLEETVREADTAARVGGDEFALLLTEVEGEAGAVEVARRVMDRLETPVNVEGHALDVGASIGVALYPQYASSFEDLLQQADLAMYGAGRSKRVGIRIYRPEHGIVTPRHDRLFGELQEALRHYRLEVHYQPVRGLDSGRVEGAEALVRWPHPRLGTLSAAKFLPLIEETEYLRRLDRWVTATVALQLGEWLENGFRGWVAVHVTESTCADPELAGYLARVLQVAEGVDPSRLVVQLPARTAAERTEQVGRLRGELGELGARVGINAFGLGRSSRDALRQLEPDLLSLDRTLLEAADREEAWREKVELAVNLGHTLGARVVAKGVERQTQRDLLRRVGCDYTEGYLEGWSLPPDEFLDRSA